MKTDCGPRGARARLVRETPDVETSSADYALRFCGAVGQWFLDLQTRTTLRLLADLPRGRVLDVGGGHAQLAGPLAAAGFDVTVLGSHPSCAWRLAEQRARGAARFVAGDLLGAPFSDRQFDVVLAFRLLPHLTRWRDLALELGRLARHAIVVDYPTRRSINAVADLLFGVKKRIERSTRPFTVFSEHEIRSAFASAGFLTAGRCPQFFVPMALHRALRAAPLSRGAEALSAGLGLTRLLGSPVILRLDRVS